MRSMSLLLLPLLLLLAAESSSASAPGKLCPKALILNSYNYPTRYVTRDGKGKLFIKKGNGTRFIERPALDGSKDAVSFEVLSSPGYYLYNYDNVIHIKKFKNESATFKKEASFKLMKGTEGFFRMLAASHPNHFIRHQSFQLKLHKWSETALFKHDSLFGVMCTTDRKFKLDICDGKFQLISKNFPTHQLIATANNVSHLAVMSGTQFKFVSPALNGNPRAVSIVAAGKPGFYLTTLQDHYIVLQKFNNSAMYKDAASFKVIIMHNGYMRLQSITNPRHYVRHREFKLRLDRWADTKLYDEDSSWKISCSLVPCKTKHFVYNAKYEHAKGPHCEFAPHKWWQLNPWCHDTAANRPSPIKIELAECKNRSSLIKPIRLGAGWHDEREFLVKNNGHSLQADAVNAADLTVAGGHLSGEFNCFQFHFHWGSQANMEKGIGSEHHLYNKTGHKLPTPMEVHIVCKRKDMNASTAVNTKDAIAVLGGFIHPLEATDHDGWAGHVVAQALLNIAAIRSPARHGAKHPTKHVEKVELQLRDLLPESLHRFVNYDGAFTTPNCNPVAQWHLFPDPMKIRKELMMDFTKTFFDADKKRPMVDNFRPLMSRHGRQLRCSFGSV